jgi:4-amino-4-deoxy-L-arabinose transferase-like glycosyltransferase
MYSLLTFFTLSSLWLFTKLVGMKGRRIPLLAGLFLTNLLLVYTHYFGWLVVGVEGLYLLFSKREHILPLSLIVAGLIICFAPWAYAVSLAAVENRGLEANRFWVSPPRLGDVAGYFAALNGLFFIRRTTSLGLILFGIPLLYWAWKTLRDPKGSSSETFRMLAACSFLPAIFTILASYLIRPVWAGRFLIISALPYLLLISSAVNRLRPAWLKTTMMIVITGWAALSGTHMLRSGNFRFDWFSLVRHMMHTEKSEKVTVYAFERYVATSLESAMGFVGEPRFEVIRVDDMTAMQRTHFWVAFRDTTWNADRLPQEFLRDSRCQVSDEASASTHIAQNPSVGEAVTVFSVTCPE